MGSPERRRSFTTEPSTAGPRSPRTRVWEPSSREPSLTSSVEPVVPSSSLCTTSSRRSSMPPCKELHFFVGKPDGLTRRENLNKKKKGKKLLSNPRPVRLELCVELKRAKPL